MCLDTEERATAVGSPPTKTITIPGERFTLSNHKDMLYLAQQKFDDIRRRSRESARSVRYDRGRGKKVNANIENAKVNQLLSSLLYLSLMMHKVDDMKKILKNRDTECYNEWKALFVPLHPPVFYMQERQIQNKRVKNIYRRKRQYKGKYERSRVDFNRIEETSQQLSHALNNLTEDNQKTHALLQEKNSVDKDLVMVQKEMEIVRSEVLKRETVINKIEGENNSMHSLIKDLEVRKAQLLQKINIDTQIAVKKEVEETEMRKDIIAKNDEITKLESEKNDSKADLQNEIARSKQNSAEFDEKLLNKNNMLEQSHAEMQTFQKKYSDENFKAGKKITSLSEDLEGTRRELKMAHNEITRTKEDLDLKTTSLDKALICQANESNNQSSLREIIISKDNEINRLNEGLRSVDIKRAEADKVQSILIKKIESDKMMQEEKIDTLERQLETALKDAKMATDKEERISTQAADWHTEKFVLKSALDQSRQDCMTFKEILQINSSTVEKIENLLTEERIALKSSIERSQEENICLTQLMEMIKGNLTHDLQCALENHHKAKEVVQRMEDQLQLIKETQQRTDKGISTLANIQSEVAKKDDENHHKAKEVVQNMEDQLQLMKETQQRTEKGISTLADVQSEVMKKDNEHCRKSKIVVQSMENQLQLMKETQQRTENGINALADIQLEVVKKDGEKYHKAKEVVQNMEEQLHLMKETQQSKEKEISILVDIQSEVIKKDCSEKEVSDQIKLEEPVSDIVLNNDTYSSLCSDTAGCITDEDQVIRLGDKTSAPGVTRVDDTNLHFHQHQQAEHTVANLLRNATTEYLQG